MRTQYLDSAASLTADFLEKTMIHAAGLPQAVLGVTQALDTGHKPKHTSKWDCCASSDAFLGGGGGEYDIPCFSYIGIKLSFLWCERGNPPGRHEPPQCRHEPPIFSKQTEPPPIRPSLRYTALHNFLIILGFSNMQYSFFLIFFQHSGTRILLKLMLFIDCHDLYLILTHKVVLKIYVLQ